ncbi:MAG: zinc-ribbon domain-containing protein [Synergistaceae bacterium]
MNIKKTLLHCNPLLCEEWNYKKNRFSPESVSPNSRKKVWWICSRGHEWQARIDSRNNARNVGTQCPYCSGKKITKERSLSFLFPDIADEIIDVDPQSVFAFSSKRHKWRCKNGHEWETRVNNRTKSNGNCPYCIGKKITKDNSLFSTKDAILNEWDYDLNEISPCEISPWSHKKVNWTCKRGHKWMAEVNQRYSLGTLCPYCSKSIHLKNGKCFSSIIEAYYYIVNYQKDLVYDKLYPSLNGKDIGNRRFDFHFPHKSLFVEITTYTNTWKYWSSYIKNIEIKREFVENVLASNFLFLQEKLTKDKIYIVKGEML